MSTRRYGYEPQPALGAVRGRRLTNREIATHLGCSPGWVGEVLLGHVHPPQQFRNGLAKMIGEPVGSLFRMGNDL